MYHRRFGKCLIKDIMLCSPYPGLKSTEIGEHLYSKKEELRHFYSCGFEGIWGISTLGLKEKTG